MTQQKNLNLMPGSGKEFADKDYWEKFFKLRGDKAFEWYGEYENLCGLIHQYIKPTERILMVGCGNSRLSESMYDVGKLTNIVNIDLSANVIQQMSAKNKNRTQMSFVKMDMLNVRTISPCNNQSSLDNPNLGIRILFTDSPSFNNIFTRINYFSRDSYSVVNMRLFYEYEVILNVILDKIS